MALRAGRHRRQGPALDAHSRSGSAPRAGRPADQPAHHLGRRGGGRRPVDRRVPRPGRARRGRVRDLRRRDGEPQPAGNRGGDARPGCVQSPRPHRNARPPLRDVRQRRAERHPRSDNHARRHPPARRPRTGAAAGRDRRAHRGGARRLGAAAAGRRGAARGGAIPYDERGGRRVLPPHDRRALRAT